MVTGLCRIHTQELDLDDPRLGPVVKFQKISGVDPRPPVFRKLFSLVTDKDGDDQLSEVSEAVYPPKLPIESTGKVELAPRT
jgi:hypothetical protein